MAEPRPETSTKAVDFLTAFREELDWVQKRRAAREGCEAGSAAEKAEIAVEEAVKEAVGKAAAKGVRGEALKTEAEAAQKKAKAAAEKSAGEAAERAANEAAENAKKKEAEEAAKEVVEQATKKAAPPEPPDGVLKDALGMDLCGLAISGGGIRSATFGLGVLQGLAATGMLRRFDYLSTVSGGGFIGSWLSAWIHREGIKRVSDQLKPARLREQPRTAGPAPVAAQRAEVEPQPEPRQITQLRRYSNYLAPVPSLFSVDGWVLIAIYLRNLLLNQFMLLLATLSAVFAARAIGDVFAYSNATDCSYAVGGALGLAFLTLAAAVVRLHYTPLRDPARPAAGMELERWLLVGLCILAAALGGTAFVQPACRTAIQAHFMETTIGFAVGGAMVHVALAGAFHFHRVRKYGRFYGLMAGGLMGIAAAFAFVYFDAAARHFHFGEAAVGVPLVDTARAAVSLSESVQVHSGVVLYAAFAPPLLLLLFVLANFLQVGLLGNGLSPYEREWWSGLNARLMMASVAWALAVGGVEFCPLLYEAARRSDWTGTLATVLSTGWVAATLSGLWAGWTSDGNGKKSGRIKEAAALVAPWVFLTGLFMVVAVLAHLAAGGTDGLVKHVLGHLKQYNMTWVGAHLDCLKAQTPNPWREGAYLVSSVVLALLCLLAALYFGRRFGVNKFSLHDLYALRLIRCYQGASRTDRTPDPLTNFDEADDLHLAMLAEPAKAKVECEGEAKARADMGPFHLLNGALNRSVGTVVANREDDSLGFLDRRAESFTFSPLRCGSKATKYCRTQEFSSKPKLAEEKQKSDDEAVGVRLGTAVATSGAAISPNGGFHTSAAVSALLTVFNLRLGAWFGNPGSVKHRGNNNPPPWYLLKELFTSARVDGDFVYVSDGGHFENMGVYELIRRRCRFIVAVDPFGDPEQLEENLGNLVRKVRIDFGIRIEVDSNATRTGPDGRSSGHVAVGRIFYGDAHPPKEGDDDQDAFGPTYDHDANQGILVYLKAGLTGDEPADLLGYREANPLFPNDPILDQNFDEAQFESYRVLGLHTVDALFREVGAGDDREAVRLDRDSKGLEKLQKEESADLFARIYHVWLAPPAALQAEYIRFNMAFAAIHEKLRGDRNLRRLARLLHQKLSEPSERNADPNQPTPPVDQPTPPVDQPNGETPTASQLEELLLAERLMALEMSTLLENAFLGLQLDRYHRHPSNAGWVDIFGRWTDVLKNNQLDDGGYKAFGPAFRAFIDKTLPRLRKRSPRAG